jgi:hypothetical protein
LKSPFARPSRLCVLALLASCGDAGNPEPPGQTSPDATSPASADERPAPTALRALVARNLGPLAEAMTQVAVEVRSEGDETPTTLLAALPDRIRRMTPDGRTAVRSPGGSFVWAAGTAAEPADAATASELEAWLTALDLLTLAPFRRAVSVRRTAPDTLEIEVGGESHAVRYRASDDTVLEVEGRGLVVRILEHHDSGTARIPTRIDSPTLGERSLRFLGTGVGFDPAAFDRPEAVGSESRAEIVIGGAANPTAPRSETLQNVSWWMVEDPRTWNERLAWIRATGRKLGAAGYGNGGDPMLVLEADKSWWAIPFRPAREEPDPVLPDAGERVRDMSGERVLVIEPEPGRGSNRVDAALEALTRHGEASGSARPAWIAVSWNLIGRDPAVDPDCLDRAPLRVMHGLGR